jgi:cytochrome c553
MEPIGTRIIEIPEEQEAVLNRNPKVGFVAYVPTGSIAKGEDLVKTGGNGKSVACAICHGSDLKGLGEVPGIAGRTATYIVRQLFMIQDGERAGPTVALMQQVVAHLSLEDMVNIAAYTASRQP